MKFSINREKLNTIISEYSNILKENPVKPILAGLHLMDILKVMNLFSIF